MNYSLDTLEQEAQRYLKNVAENWIAFCMTAKAIKDSGLYKETGLTWSAYVNSRFSMSYSMLKRYFIASELAQAIETVTNVTLSEGTIRALKAEYPEQLDDLPTAVGLAQSALSLIPDSERVELRHIKSAMSVIQETRATGGYVSLDGEMVALDEQSPIVLSVAEHMREANARYKQARQGNTRRIKAYLVEQENTEYIRLRLETPTTIYQRISDPVILICSGDTE